MLRIKNTALDRTKTLLHRTAPKLEMEPMINGLRLRLNTSLDVTYEWAEKNKDYLQKLISHGTIDITEMDGSQAAPKFNDEGLQLGGPTLERWIEAGYTAEAYPPKGYAEVPSAGLTALRKEQEDKKSYEELKAQEEADLAARLAAEEAQRLATEEAARKAAEEAAREVVVDAPPVPAPEVAPSPAPVVEDKSDAGKKNSGKKLR